MAQTIKCIYCRKSAQAFSGHVHNGVDIIIVGRCFACRSKDVRGLVIRKGRVCQGCYGDYAQWMGRRQG